MTVVDVTVQPITTWHLPAIGKWTSIDQVWQGWNEIWPSVFPFDIPAIAFIHLAYGRLLLLLLRRWRRRVLIIFAYQSKSIEWLDFDKNGLLTLEKNLTCERSSIKAKKQSKKKKPRKESFWKRIVSFVLFVSRSEKTVDNIVHCVITMVLSSIVYSVKLLSIFLRRILIERLKAESSRLDWLID